MAHSLERVENFESITRPPSAATLFKEEGIAMEILSFIPAH